MKKEILIIFLLLLISFPAVRSLLQSGGFTSHDMTHHIVRQISMDKLLSEGQFPPRWSGDLASGYGYPVFLFNYPLPALVGELFHLAGFNFVDSVKAVLFFSLILSTAGMYLFLKSLFNSYLSAVLGAVFYLYSPIHMIVVYVSGSAGASLGLVFPPFIFWAMVKMWQGESRKFLLVGAIAFAGLILSHNITAFIFTPLILGFVITLKLLKNKGKNPHFLYQVALMFLLGVGLSAFFWLPAMAEKQFIRYDQLMKQIYLNQFPTFQQIIYSPWGYGLSHPKSPAGGMSYQIGLIHILVVIVLASLIWLMRKTKAFLLFSIFIILSFAASIFFMLEASQPLWDRLPFLSYVQFPVRILIAPTFVASLAAALLIRYLPGKKALFTLLLILVLIANRNHLNINQQYDPGEEYYLSLKTSSTSFDENLPIWVNKIRTDSDHGKFTFLSGGGEVQILENKSAKVLAEIEATTSSMIRFNQYFFPGWQINIDGKSAKINYLEEQYNGLPTFNLGAGQHKVLAQFTNTPLRSIADGISLISIVIWLSLLVWLLWKKKILCKRSVLNLF